jgi:hypothetical protein
MEDYIPQLCVSILFLAIEKERDTLFECASRWQPLQLAAAAGKKKKQFFSSPSPFFQLC